jgi:hypothetical protein
MGRTAAAALLGLLAWGLLVFIDALRMLFSPFLWERVTLASLGWLGAYAFLFSAAGVACLWLSAIPLRIARFLLTGAVVGALVWSYLTVTWAFTARAAAVVAPVAGLAEAALTGAALGAAGGLILFAAMLLRP